MTQTNPTDRQTVWLARLCPFRRYVCGLLCLLLCPLFAWGQQPSEQSADTPKRKRFDRGIVQQTFVPKGQWLTGISFSYADNNSHDFRFLVVDKMTAEGYTLRVTPSIGYFFKDNMAAGLQFAYKRSYVNMQEVSIKLSDDMTFELQDVYNLEHAYYGTAFLRTYVNLGDSKRFGLYNDVRLVVGGGQGKAMNGKGETLTGTYQKTTEVQLGIAPGLVAFVDDNVAVEVSVGVLGLSAKRVRQVTDQVVERSHVSRSANFKIDLFSINLGVAFYIPNLHLSNLSPFAKR